MNKILFALIGLLLLSCQSASHTKYDEMDMGDYVIVPLTDGLIENLGDIRSFQIYLSSPFSLFRSVKSGESEGADSGAIQRFHDKFRIEFDTDIPGVFKQYSEFGGHKGMMVLFDNTDLSFLPFEEKYRESRKKVIVVYELKDNSLSYEGFDWKVDFGSNHHADKSDVFLVLHLDKDIYERLHSKKAKGRTLDSGE